MKLWMAVAIAAALVIFRSLPFLTSVELMDSDQAVYGLMAKHIAEGSAYPLFMYGIKYLLAVSAWLAAPIYYITGVTILGLKLPMVAINLFIGIALVVLSVREAKVKPWEALVASLFFLIPSLASSSSMNNAGEGSVESFAFVLLTWIFWNRPIAVGLIIALGYAHRPFAAYGAVALALLELLRGELRERKTQLRLALRVGVAVPAFLLIRHLASLDFNYHGRIPPGFYLKNPRFVFEDLRGFLVEIMPRSLGYQVQKYVPLGLDSPYTIPTIVLYLFSLYLVFRGLKWLKSMNWSQRLNWARRPELRFPLFLLLTGAAAAGVYVLFVPPVGDYSVIRYSLLVILAPVGLALAFFATGPSRMRKPVLGCVLALALVNTFAVARSIPAIRDLDAKQETARLIAHLREKDLRYGFTDYWLAYRLAFLTSEELIYTTDFPRILQYDGIVASAPQKQRATILFEPCEGGEKIAKWYVCPYGEKLTSPAISETLRRDDR